MPNSAVLERNETIMSVNIDEPRIDAVTHATDATSTTDGSISAAWLALTEESTLKHNAKNTGNNARGTILATYGHYPKTDDLKSDLEYDLEVAGLWNVAAQRYAGAALVKSARSSLKTAKSQLLAAHATGLLPTCQTWQDVIALGKGKKTEFAQLADHVAALLKSEDTQTAVFRAIIDALANVPNCEFNPE